MGMFAVDARIENCPDDSPSLGIERSPAGISFYGRDGPPDLRSHRKIRPYVVNCAPILAFVLVIFRLCRLIESSDHANGFALEPGIHILFAGFGFPIVGELLVFRTAGFFYRLLNKVSYPRFGLG